MIRVVFRRLLEAVPVLFVIVTLTFFLVRLAPGGPFDREKAVPEEIKKRIEAYYNLDGPLIGQYADYLKDLLHGNLGPSFKNSSYSVNEMIGTSFPVSLELGFYALCIALVTGLTLGIIESYAAMFFGPEYSVTISFTLLILLLMFRPTGIMGRRGFA